MTATAKSLEEQAREAAVASGLDNYKHRRHDFADGYILAATLRDKECEELRAELADWRESARKASGERCEDEIHCCCVPYLRVEIDKLRALVKELETKVPRWVRSSDDAQRLLLIHGGWRAAIEVVQPETATLWKLYVPPALVVPPIPLPEGEA